MKQQYVNYGTEFQSNEIDKEIDYFSDYKKKLIQFLIVNTAYKKGYSRNVRTVLNAGQMTSIFKEISRIEIFIYDLKLLKKDDSSIFYYIYDKYI
mgnify:FL=1